MRFDDFPEEYRRNYRECLQRISALGRLFSESSKPYLDYRVVENLYCRCFGAENLSRACIAVDARIESSGIGIKTFVDNSPLQKIAEFDEKSKELDTGDVLEDARRVSELRNERLDFANRTYAIRDFSYHYVVRHDNALSIHECPMDYIDLGSLKIGKQSRNSFEFSDGANTFKFNRSKSTLYESFPMDSPVMDFGTFLLDDPIEALRGLTPTGSAKSDSDERSETIVLPLFSNRGSRHVPEHSGLNQWNANGRPRDYDEIYIPYNKEYRSASEGFFPDRETPFDLRLPNGRTISAKICQESGKAIMSNPNKDLGKWLLRDVLGLEKGRLVTMEMLDDIGIDSVLFTKLDDGTYSIDFTKMERGMDDRFRLVTDTSSSPSG